jgi:phosphoadenosine phosphosulfate reductase
VQDLWGNVDPHIQHSIALLKEYEPPEGYYLAFSGGKDSIVCYDLCQKAEVKFDAHYMRAMEPPELVYFIRKNYPNVIRHLPKETMWSLIRKNGIPPLRTIRYCCRILKEIGGKGRTVIVGIRRAESSARSNRQEVAQVGKKPMVSPILFWSTEQVWKYIKDNNIAYPSLYDEGQRRIGCVMCPCGGPSGMKHDSLRWPKIANAYRRACIKSFDKIINDSWKDGNDMYEWWISGKSFGKEPTLWEESEV